MQVEAKLITEAWDKVLEFPNILYKAIQLTSSVRYRKGSITKRAGEN